MSGSLLSDILKALGALLFAAVALYSLLKWRKDKKEMNQLDADIRTGMEKNKRLMAEIDAKPANRDSEKNSD